MGADRLENKLSGPDYSLESLLARLEEFDDTLEEGDQSKQKIALGKIFESVSINEDEIS
jgi:hypothetical protein